MAAPLRLFLKISAGFVVLLISTILILTLIGVKVDLSYLRSSVEVTASLALGRDVSINGPVELEFSHWPALEMSDVRIANTEGAERPDFLKADFVRMKLGILPLLFGELQIADITAQGVTLDLVSDVNGNPNWVFDASEKKSPEKISTTDTKQAGLVVFTGLDQLHLEKISVNYLDEVLNRSTSTILNSLHGTAARGESISLELAGNIQDQNYDLVFKGDSLANLADKQKPWKFTINGEVADKKVSGEGGRVMRDHQAEIDVAIGTSNIDVGAILDALGLVENMQATLGDVAIKLTVSGNSLNEVLRRSSIAFKIEDGSWLVGLPNSEGRIEINKLSGDIEVEKGNNITMKLKGLVGKEPVKLLVTGAPLVEYVTRQDEIPLAIAFEVAKSKLSFATRVKLPISSRDVTVTLNVSSERIDYLNNLLQLDLPAIGPVSFDAKLNVNEKSADLSKLQVRVGDSQLEGKLKLDTSQNKPVLSVTLKSKLVQLDDFKAITDQAEADATDKTEEEKPKEELPSVKRKPLLSYEVLSAFDANIKIEALEVLSGKDKLGSGLVKVNLKDSRLSVDPVIINIPGGKIQASMNLTPTPKDVSFDMKLDISEFDIGVLARRAKPGTDMGGKLTMDVSLQSQAPEPATILKYANGHLDFVLVPENFSAGILDLWAVNILTAVMDKTTEKDQSRINCVVMRFGLRDGLMKEKAIYLDSTKMLVEGKSDINFKNRELDIQFSPGAKKPEFFSLAVPIRVTGKFDDFELKIGALPMAGKVISFITSPLHVPVRRIFTEDAPADGVSACKAAWNKTAITTAD